MATKKRIYSVKRGGVVVDLVRATNPAQAYAHMARNSWNVDVATPDELVSATQAGINVQEVPVEPAGQQS